MNKANDVRKRYGIPKNVNVKLTDYSTLPDRKIVERIGKIEARSKGRHETLEDATVMNELQVLRQEVQRRKLQISA